MNSSTVLMIKVDFGDMDDPLYNRPIYSTVSMHSEDDDFPITLLPALRVYKRKISMS
jgi:hypothetical protein